MIIKLDILVPDREWILVVALVAEFEGVPHGARASGFVGLGLLKAIVGYVV